MQIVQIGRRGTVAQTVTLPKQTGRVIVVALSLNLAVNAAMIVLLIRLFVVGG